MLVWSDYGLDILDPYTNGLVLWILTSCYCQLILVTALEAHGVTVSVSCSVLDSISVE
jgi:hypothetical protein